MGPTNAPSAENVPKKAYLWNRSIVIVDAYGIFLQIITLFTEARLHVSLQCLRQKTRNGLPSNAVEAIIDPSLGSIGYIDVAPPENVAV